MHADDLARIKVNVRHQVSHALREQFQSFAQELTVMFSHMMMSQQSSNAIKRRADQREDCVDEGAEIAHTTMEDAKRWDNKSTPKKAIPRATIGKEYDGQMTSITSELQTLSQALWNSTQNTPQSKTVLGNKNSQTERAGYHKRNKSEPDKSDFTTLGSGT
jgi:hypothetical protein